MINKIIMLFIFYLTINLNSLFCNISKEFQGDSLKTVITYYESSKIKSNYQMIYLGDSLCNHGLSINYYKNGNIKSIVDYKKGIKNGLNQDYLESGKLWYSAYYQDGVVLKEYSYYPNNGYPKAYINYKSGKDDGLYTTYYLNGKIKEIGNHKNNTRIGLWKTYYETGKLEAIGNFSGEYIFVSLDRQNWKINFLDRNNQFIKESDISKSMLEKIGDMADEYYYFKTGEWKYFDEKGDLKFTEFFKNGELIKTY